MRKRILRGREYSYTVAYEPLRKGGYQVVVPLLPGLVTYGRNFEEAREMAQDAIRCYVEGLMKDREIIPRENSLLQERVAVRI